MTLLNRYRFRLRGGVPARGAQPRADALIGDVSSVRTSRGHARWTSLPLRTKGMLMTALPAIALAGALVVILLAEQQYARNDADVKRTAWARLATEHVLSLAVDVETGVRGYLSTGDRTFLRPAINARRELPAALNQMDRLLDALPGQEPNQHQLRIHEAQVLDQLSALERLGPSHPRNRARLNRLAVAGRTTMDLVRSDAAALTSYESKQEEARIDARAAAQKSANRAILVVGILGLLGGLGGSSMLMSSLVRRVRHVQQNATRLAAGEPLLPDHGRDQMRWERSRMLSTRRPV